MSQPQKISDSLYTYRNHIIRMVEEPCSTGWSRHYFFKMEGNKCQCGTLKEVAAVIDRPRKDNPK